MDGSIRIGSCVEAGVDFSFRTAFRESWGLVNLLQIAGRAEDWRSQISDWLHCRFSGIADRRFQIADWLGRKVDAGKLPMKPLGHDGELWAWIGAYNSFLGYMAGVLPLLKAGKAGFEPL